MELESYISEDLEKYKEGLQKIDDACALLKFLYCIDEELIDTKEIDGTKYMIWLDKENFEFLCKNYDTNEVSIYQPSFLEIVKLVSTLKKKPYPNDLYDDIWSQIEKTNIINAFLLEE